MTKHTVHVGLNSLGKVVCSSEPVVVEADDEVEWGSFLGDVDVQFDPRPSPFTNPRPVWHSPKGGTTAPLPPGKVKSVAGAGASMRRFKYTVTLTLDTGEKRSDDPEIIIT